MAQFGRPDSDVSTGSWSQSTGSTLWETLDEVTPSDSDFIQDAAANTTCEVGLTTLTDPVSSVLHVVRFRMRASGSGGPERVNVQLIQGTTVIGASGNQTNRSGSFAEKTFTLTSGEADSITNYADLRLRIIASNQAGGETVDVSWCEFEVPDAAVGDLDIDISDSITVTDSDNVVIPLIVINLLDSITVTEDLSISVDPLLLNFNETITTIDNLSISVDPLLLNFNETITTIDNLTIAIPLLINLIDSITTIDNIVIVVDPLVISIFDTITITEDVTRRISGLIVLALSDDIAASGENTTFQLTAPATKSTSDFDAGRIQDDENPADTIDITTDNYTEIEWSIKALSDITLAQYEFRVTVSGTVLDTYTITPKLTFGTVNLAISVFDSVTANENISLLLNPLVISLFDSITTNEITSILLDPLGISLFDSITINDIASILFNPLVVSVFDIITSTDITSILFNPLVISTFDVITNVDIVNISVDPLVVFVFDIITSTDIVNISVDPLLINLFESISSLEREHYLPNPSLYDGFNFLTLGSGLTGLSDGNEGTVSYWVRVDGGNGTNRRIFRDDAGFFSAAIIGNKHHFTCLAVDVEILMQIDTVGTILEGDGWHHVICSWRLDSTPIAYIYVDDVSDKNDLTTPITGTIDYTRSD